MSEQHMVVEPIDETLWQQYLDSLGDDDGSVILLDEEDSDDDDDDDASSDQKPKAEFKKREKEKEREEVVVLSSDSESEEDPFWSNSRKARDFKQLWERARFIIFHKLMSSSFLRPDDEPIFPYQKLQDLADSLKDFQKKNHLSNDELDFLWRNVLQWLLAIKLSSDPLDLTYDQKFNYILVDFMVQFINVENKLNLLLDNERLVADAVGKMMQVLSIVFNGNNLLILKTLLRIDLRAEYSEMLDPVFNLLMLNSSKKLKKAVERNFILYKRFINRQRATQALNQIEEKRAALVLNRQPADHEERAQNPGSRLSVNAPQLGIEGRRKLGNRAVPRRRLEILGGINSQGDYSIEKPTDRFKINLECLDCIELDSTDDESESLHNNRNIAEDKDSTKNCNSSSNSLHQALDKENIIPDQQNIQCVVDKERDEDLEKDNTAINLSANFYQNEDTKVGFVEQSDLTKNEIEPAPDATMETTDVEIKPEKESETLVKSEPNPGAISETKADDESNSDITAINSRVGKLCIPGEVSSTTCMDNAGDAAKVNVINPNEIVEGTPPLPSALKVLSPETCRVGCEVQPLKQQMSPCQSDAVTGNYKPQTSWNVINEATSTTEVSQKTQSATTSPAAVVPKPTETIPETEISCPALGDSKSSTTIQKLIDDMPNSQSSTKIQNDGVLDHSQSSTAVQNSLDDVPDDSQNDGVLGHSQSSTAVQNSLDDVPADSQSDGVLGHSQSRTAVLNSLDDVPDDSQDDGVLGHSQSRTAVLNSLDDVTDDSQSTTTIQNGLDDTPSNSRSITVASNSQSSTTIQNVLDDSSANSQSITVANNAPSSNTIQNALDDPPGNSQSITIASNSQSCTMIQNMLDDIPTCSKYVKQKPVCDLPLPICASRGQDITEPLDRNKDTLQDTDKPTSIPKIEPERGNFSKSEAEITCFPIYEDISMESIDSDIKIPIENEQSRMVEKTTDNHLTEEEKSRTTRQQNFVGASWQNIACLQRRGQNVDNDNRSYSNLSRRQQNITEESSDECVQKKNIAEKSSDECSQKQNISEENTEDCVTKEHYGLKSFNDRETMEAAETERLLKEVEEHLAKIEVRTVDLNIERSDIEDSKANCISDVVATADLSLEEDGSDTKLSKSHNKSIFLNENSENSNSKVQTSAVEEISLDKESIIPNLEMQTIDEIETMLDEGVALEAFDILTQEKESFLNSNTNHELVKANASISENVDDNQKVSGKEVVSVPRSGSFDLDQEAKEAQARVGARYEKVKENVTDLNVLQSQSDQTSKHRNEAELENVDQSNFEMLMSNREIHRNSPLNSIEAGSSVFAEAKLGESSTVPSHDSLDVQVISHPTEAKINNLDLDINFTKAEASIPEKFDSKLIADAAELQSCTSDIIEMPVENEDSCLEGKEELKREQKDENAEVIQTIKASAKKSDFYKSDFHEQKHSFTEEKSNFLDHIYVKEGKNEQHSDFSSNESISLTVKNLSEQETEEPLKSPKHDTNLEEVNIFADMSDVLRDTSAQQNEIMSEYMSGVVVDTTFHQIENMHELDVIQHEEVATHTMFFANAHLEGVESSSEFTTTSSDKIVDEGIANPNEDTQINSSVSINIESPKKIDYGADLQSNELNIEGSSKELHLQGNENIADQASTDADINLSSSVTEEACNLELNKKIHSGELLSAVCEDLPENIFDLDQEKSQIVEEILSSAVVDEEIDQNEPAIIIDENLSFSGAMQVDGLGNAPILNLSNLEIDQGDAGTENDYANKSDNILTLNFTLPEDMNPEEIENISDVIANSFIYDIDMQSTAMASGTKTCDTNYSDLEELLNHISPPLEEDAMVSTKESNSPGIESENELLFNANSRFEAEHPLYPNYPSLQAQPYEEHTPSESYMVENLSDISDEERTSDVPESSRTKSPDIKSDGKVTENLLLKAKELLNTHDSVECLTTTDMIQDAVYEDCPLSGSQITEEQYILFQTLELRSILGDAINTLDENKNSSGYAYEIVKQEDDPLFLNHAEVLKAASESRFLWKQALPTNRKTQEEIVSEPGEQKVCGSQTFPELIVNETSKAPLAVPELKLSIELGRIRTPGAKKVYEVNENQVNPTQLAVAEKIKDEFKVPKVSLRLPTDTLKTAFKQTGKFITRTREDWDYLNIPEKATHTSRKRSRSKSKRSKVQPKQEENNLFGPITLENVKREAVNTHDTLQCLQKVEEAIRTFEESQVNEEKKPSEIEQQSGSRIEAMTENTESIYLKLFPETNSVKYIKTASDYPESTCHKLLKSVPETYSPNQAVKVEPTVIEELEKITPIASHMHDTELFSKPSAVPKGRIRRKPKGSVMKRKVENPVLQNPFVKLKRLKLLDIQHYDQADKAQSNPPNSLINFENFYVTELQKNQKVRIRKPSDVALAEDDKNMTAQGSKKRATPATRKKNRGRTSKKEQGSMLGTVNNLMSNNTDSDIGRNLDNIILALPKNILNDNLADEHEDLDDINIFNSGQIGKHIDVDLSKTIVVEEEGDSETGKDEEDATKISKDDKNKKKDDSDDPQNDRGGESNNPEHGEPNEDKDPNNVADEEPKNGGNNDTRNVRSNSTQNEDDNKAGATDEEGKTYIEDLKSDKVCASPQLSTINIEIGKKILKRKAEKTEENVETTKSANDEKNSRKTEGKNKTAKNKESSSSNQIVNEKGKVKRKNIPKHYDRTDIFDDYESDESMDIEATQSVIAELKLLSPENYVRQQKILQKKLEKEQLVKSNEVTKQSQEDQQQFTEKEGPLKQQEEQPKEMTESHTEKQAQYSWEDAPYVENPQGKKAHSNEMKVQLSKRTREPNKKEKLQFNKGKDLLHDDNELITESKELSMLQNEQIDEKIEPEMFFEKLKGLQDVKLIHPSTFCGTLSGQKLTFNLDMVLNGLQEDRKKGGYWDYKDIKTHWGIEIETGTYNNLKDMHFSLPAALFDGDEDIEEHKFEPPLIKTDTDGLEEKGKPKVVEPVELAYLGTPSHSVELIEENSQQSEEKEEDSKSIEVSSLEEPEPLSEIEPLDIPIDFGKNEINYPDLLDNIFDKVQCTNDCLISGRDSHVPAQDIKIIDNKPIHDSPDGFVSPTPVNEAIGGYELTLDGLVNSFTSDKLLSATSKTEKSNNRDCPADSGFGPIATNTSAPIDHDYNLDVNSLKPKDIDSAMPMLPLTPDMSPTGTFKCLPNEDIPVLPPDITPIDFSDLADLDILSPSTLTSCHDEGLILTQLKSVMDQISDLYRANMPPQYSMVPPAVINNHSVNAAPSTNFPISQSFQQPPQFPPLSTCLKSDEFLMNDPQPQPPPASLELFDIVPITPPQPAHTFINHNSSSNIQTPPYPDFSAYENCAVHNMQNLELDSCDANFEFSSKLKSPEPSTPTPTPPPEKIPKPSPEPIKPMTSNEIFDMLKHEKPLNEVVPKPDPHRRKSHHQSTSNPSKTAVKSSLLKPAKTASFQEAFSRLVTDGKLLPNSNFENATEIASPPNGDACSKQKTEPNKDAKKTSSTRREISHTQEKDNQEPSSAKQSKKDKHLPDITTDKKQKERRAEKRGQDTKSVQRSSPNKSKQKSACSISEEKRDQKSSRSTKTVPSDSGKDVKSEKTDVKRVHERESRLKATKTNQQPKEKKRHPSPSDPPISLPRSQNKSRQRTAASNRKQTTPSNVAPPESIAPIGRPPVNSNRTKKTPRSSKSAKGTQEAAKSPPKEQSKHCRARKDQHKEETQAPKQHFSIINELKKTTETGSIQALPETAYPPTASSITRKRNASPIATHSKKSKKASETCDNNGRKRKQCAQLESEACDPSYTLNAKLLKSQTQNDAVTKTQKIPKQKNHQTQNSLQNHTDDNLQKPLKLRQSKRCSLPPQQQPHSTTYLQPRAQYSNIQQSNTEEFQVQRATEPYAQQSLFQNTGEYTYQSEPPQDQSRTQPHTYKQQRTRRKYVNKYSELGKKSKEQKNNSTGKRSRSVESNMDSYSVSPPEWPETELTVSTPWVPSQPTLYQIIDTLQGNDTPTT